MPALKILYRTIFRPKKTLMLKPPAGFIPAPQAKIFRERASFCLRYIAAHIVGTIALHCAIQYAKPGISIPALFEAGKRNIVEKAGERIENVQKSMPEFVRTGLRNIEDNAEKRLANFEKLSPSAGMHVDFDSRESIRSAAAIKAKDVMSFYHGQEPGHTPGILSGPGPEHHDYGWWKAGALWGTMVDYWKYTGDSTYNDVVQASLLSQAGPDSNYMEPNVTAFIGNDDQSFWGLSAMLAAESNFQNPPPEDPQWLALAEAVFNSQTGPDRRDGSCGGGLRWQVFALNGGYSYKNAISNGLYFNLAARLARYTGDSSYARHAAETFDWMLRVGLVDGGSFDVFDGAHVEHDCQDINRAQFSYNAAVLLQGAAFMYDFTGGEAVWAHRVDGLLGSMLRTFFVPPFGDGESDERIAFEPACEGGASNVPADGCTGDMLVFKGFSARWMAATAQLCPWTRDSIMAVLRSSAEAAVRQCSGGANGRMCGMHWSSGRYDGTVGVGQEMNVLSALMVLLGDEPVDSYGGSGDWQGELDNAAQPPRAPLTHDTGGTSEGDPNAGQSLESSEVEFEPITAADVSLAATATSAVIIFMFMIFVFMCSETVRPHKDDYIELSDVERRGRAETVFVSAPLSWVDLEERRPSRRASKVRITTANGRSPARPAKSFVALHQHRRATVYREEGDSVFGGDEASDAEDVRRTRMRRSRRVGDNLNKRGQRLHAQPAVARGKCQRRDVQSSERR